MQVLHHQAGMKGEQICQKPTCFIIQQLVKLMLPFPRFCSDTTGLQALVTASHYFQAAAKTSDQLPAPHVNLVPLTAPVPISYFLTKIVFLPQPGALCHGWLPCPPKLAAEASDDILLQAAKEPVLLDCRGGNDLLPI